MGDMATNSANNRESTNPGSYDYLRNMSFLTTDDFDYDNTSIDSQRDAMSTARRDSNTRSGGFLPSVASRSSHYGSQPRYQQPPNFGTLPDMSSRSDPYTRNIRPLPPPSQLPTSEGKPTPQFSDHHFQSSFPRQHRDDRPQNRALRMSELVSDLRSGSNPHVLSTQQPHQGYDYANKPLKENPSNDANKPLRESPLNDENTSPVKSLVPKSRHSLQFHLPGSPRTRGETATYPSPSNSNEREMSSNFRRGNQNRVAPKSQGREFPSQTLVSGHSQRDFRFIPSTSTVATSFDEGPKRSHVPVNRGVPTSSSKGAFGDREKDSAASSFTAGQADQSSASSVEDYDAPVDKARGKHRFKSYQLDGKYDQPWVSDPRMNRTRWNNWILRAFMFIGVALSAYICFSATQTVGKHSYCLVYQDDFKTLDTNVWTHEVQIDGFGNGCFDWTTTDSKNSYVDATGLHIVPTLTNETTTLTNEQILNGGKLNLTKSAGDGTCTGTELRSCAIASNSTTGRMLPPVRSARLTTKGKKSIRYGKVEVVAKMPRGDWIWPAIWMMPVDSKYGVWPRSGEIDIVESRGNDVDYSPGGRDVLTSTLHWGPTTIKDAFWRTTAGKNLRRDDFTNKFHTYGMEWTEDYIYTYLDSQLVQVLFTGFKGQNLWDLGKFATAEENKTLLANPWPSKSLNAPFDQDFYLILNVAVGGINGWFPDGIDAKPWLNAADSPQRDFYKGVDTWLPTWGEGDKRGMTVRSVKMWQQGACS